MSAARIWRARGGAVAVEFAIIAQVFAVIFAGTAEIGIIYLKRLQLNNTLAAATNYAMVNTAAVSSAGGAALATTLAAVLTDDGVAAPATVTIVVNNGPRRSILNGAATTAGTAADADRCYCPTATTTVTWGSPVTCGSACASGLRGGKFVELRVSRPHTALFSGFGGVRDGKIALMSLVQTE
ncbi:TadE/TadG family type IV pilus assembly protein [Glacieibacterium frigidum]|uniref:Pilus assembly protein n=1 Tax=Glacieibacterium frigidum TaxID=2593303 RepID=A0A552UGH4_9SPHN|nr:TadE/TadG family type IV pilus assembly protein [Glacieibacterium frigidum]TRW17314.1 pilus assembly protein [Glacieibacterium frigidum]